MKERFSGKEKINEQEKSSEDTPCSSEGVFDVQSEIQNELSLSEVDALIINDQIEKLQANAGASYILRPREKEPFENLNARERVFLESYSKPPYYVPHEEKSEANSEAVIEHAPMSARLFPDALYRNLKREDFNHKKNTAEGLNERAEKFDVIREFFKTLKPLNAILKRRRYPKKSSRIFISTEGDNKGALIMTRKPSFKRGPVRYNNYYPDIYSALRAQTHIIELYSGRYKQDDLEGRGELEMLKIMHAEVQRIIAFLQNWKFASESEKQEVEMLLHELEGHLNADTNVYKEKAHERLSKAKTLDDSRKKQKNPPAASARLVGAYNDLLKRSEEVFRMMGVVFKDREILSSIRNDTQIKFTRSEMDLSSLLDDEYFKPFEALTTPNTFLKMNAGKINKRIFNRETKTGLISRLRSIAANSEIPAPYPRWAEAVLSNLRVVYGLNQRIAAGKVEPDDIKQTHDTLCEYAIRAQLALRYQNLQRRFMELIDNILNNPDKLSAEKIQNEALDLLKLFNPHAIGKSFERRDDLKFVEDSFEEFTGQLNEVIGLTFEWQKAREEIYAKNREILNENKGAANEEALNRLIENENELNKLEREFLDKIYRMIADTDFSGAIETLTVDVEKVID